jgi:ribonuclease T1
VIVGPIRRRIWWLAAAVAVAALLAGGTVGWVANRLTGPDRAPAVAATPRSDLPAVALAGLPPQARDTIVLVDRGGPFPYAKDGTTFGNLEKLLPARPHGYYREYTVPTPGERDRGARRIVAGSGGDMYYTDDHYRSFRQVVR